MQYNNHLLSWPALDLAIDRNPLSVAPDTPLLDVIALMRKAQVGVVKGSSLPSSNSTSDWNIWCNNGSIAERAESSCALVVDGLQLVGLFTEQDVVRLVAEGIELAHFKIKDVISQPAIALTQCDSQDIASALSLLRQYRLSHLPVVDPQGQLVGIVTPGSICQALQPTLAETTQDGLGTLPPRWAKDRSNRGAQDTMNPSSPLHKSTRSQKHNSPRHPITLLSSSSDGATLVREVVLNGKTLVATTVSEKRSILYTLDRQGVFTLSEGNGLQPLGLEPHQVVGQSVFDIYRNYPHILENISLVLAGSEGKWIAKVGDLVYEHRATPLFNQNGQAIGLIGVATEITEGEKAEVARQESEERFRIITDPEPVLIWATNREGQCTFFNQPCADSKPEKMGDRWAENIHREDRQRCLETYLSACTQRQSFWMEYQIARADGEYRWLLDTGIPRFTPSGEFAGYVGSSIDITERKHKEEELETRVEELTDALSKSNRQLQAEIAKRKRAQKELQQAKDQLCAIWDAVPGRLSWISSDLRYIGVNRHLAATFNLPPEAFVGQEIGFLECSQEFVDSVMQFFASPEEETTQELTVDVDGDNRFYLIVAQKYNHSSAAVLVGIDITERKQAEEELRATTSRLTTLIQNLQAGILLEDESRQVVLVNQEFCTMMGIPGEPQSLIGADFSQFPLKQKNRCADPEKFVQRIEEILQLRQVVTNEELHLADGRTFERDYVPIFVEENYSGHLWMYRDITQRQQMEDELKLALAKEKELSELKSRFVTMTSHEFRTPLSTILSSAELLEHYGYSWTQSKQLTHLHRIQSAVKHMTQLLHNVLIIGSWQAGIVEFQPSPLDVSQFCRQLLEELHSDEDSKSRYQFIYHKDGNGECSVATNNGQLTTHACIACLDEKLLRQILENLLSNATKYSPAGSTVKLAVTCFEDKVVFQIQDDGIGIPAEDQAYLFESFHRATNVGNIPGTGLGLTIVKKCVDLHGGQITLESKVGVGSTFTVTLPLVQGLNV